MNNLTTLYTHQKLESYKWHHPHQRQIGWHPLTMYEPEEQGELRDKNIKGA